MVKRRNNYNKQEQVDFLGLKFMVKLGLICTIFSPNKTTVVKRMMKRLVSCGNWSKGRISLAWPWSNLAYFG